MANLKAMTQDDIDMLALDLMECKDGDNWPSDEAGYESLLQSYGDMQAVRTVLMRAKKPLDVESRLKAFHADNDLRSHRTLIRRIGVAVIAVAAVALAVFILRPTTVEKPVAKPLPKGTVYVADAQKYVSVSNKNGATVALKANSNNVVLQPENYITSDVKKEDVTIRVPYGHSADIELPDGSMAYVHTGSEVSFIPAYVGGKRIVQLKGEAYFKVKHDAAHPFVVSANGVETTVLGTEFNVNADGGSTKVTLISGSVKVTSGKHAERIEPGTQAVASAGGIATRHVDVQPYINWRDGYFYYDNVELGDIMKAIGKTYNLTIKFNNLQALHYKTHFVAERTKGIDAVLDMINRMGKIKVTLSDSTIIVN